MKERNLESFQEWLLSQEDIHISDRTLFGFMDRLEVFSEMKTRLHTFTCGEKGEVVDEITVKIKIPRLDIQPDNSFEETAVESMVKDFMTTSIQPWFENAE